MGEASKIYGMLFVMLLAVCSFVFLSMYHRKYYTYMKKFHNDEWCKLMKRDPFVDTAGEWIRWPVGSIYLLLSIFKISETYNDRKIEKYKKRYALFFVAFAIFFVLALVMAVVLPRW